MWTGVQRGLLIFNARKNQLVSFERSIDSGSIDVNMNGLAFEEKSSFKILELSFSSKLDWNFCVFCIAKAASKKIGALIGSKEFPSSELALSLHKSLRGPQIVSIAKTTSKGLVPWYVIWSFLLPR